jgi:hydrogenase maturation protein HypF
MTELVGAQIHVTGVVQGVGFRPFVYGLATRLAVNGWVRNTSAGVDIAIDGSPAVLTAFVEALRRQAPPLARIDAVSLEEHPCNGFTSFEIVHSQSVPDAFQPIPPDVGICTDCLRELFDPGDRRYLYPFINCTNCGPRFTIIQDIPYDRPNTTMAQFEMCPDCAADYANPLDRRFHAQPIACPKCGPQIWLEANGKSLAGREEVLPAARRLLAEGTIIAVKGLGGFHLACDATNADVVGELRRRKLRVDKPFALMMPDLATVESHCLLIDAERELLQSRERPIVILKRRPESEVAREIAPGQDTLAVMLPYTPLHYLLLMPDGGAQSAVSESSSALGGRRSAVMVMTSGNLSEEPIATENDEARERLATLADAFLMHDREIRTRCDDSVVRVFAPSPSMAEGDMLGDKAVYPLRRSRGYAPFPVRLPFDSPPILAAGAELKNTFCITREPYAFLSHHIGNLENYETLRSFEDGVAHFERLFRVRPEVLAYDLHPNYLATRYALERAEREGLAAIGVQHHHAHVAACMAEHGLAGERPVIGVSFDGTGYGEDGAIWGGEFLIADYAGYRRAFHLDYVPMPGGDRAVREPWRLALAWLQKAGMEWDGDLAPVQGSAEEARRTLLNQILRGINAPPTSSMGRLFDAVSALAGTRQTVNYEAQAAIEFEALADGDETGSYPFHISNPPETDGGRAAKSQAPSIVDPTPMIRAVVADLRAGVSVPIISARFHNGVTAMVDETCRALRSRFGLSEVALSGGVWQNMTLLRRTVTLLRNDGFSVYFHRLVPANDGGLALGQAAIAACKRRQA